MSDTLGVIAPGSTHRRLGWHAAALSLARCSCARHTSSEQRAPVSSAPVELTQPQGSRCTR
eukprot:8481245-Alexandrium_andersonii.AAC.1